MAMTGRRGLMRAGELPGTLKRSSKEAQEAFTRAHASAVQAYGDGDEAYRAAYAEFKQKFEKCGDHWIPKAEPEDDVALAAAVHWCAAPACGAAARSRSVQRSTVIPSYAAGMSASASLASMAADMWVSTIRRAPISPRWACSVR